MKTSDMTYTVIRINGCKIFATKEDFVHIREAMFEKKPCDYTDIDGTKSVVNTRFIDFLDLSTPEARKLNDAIMRQARIDDPEPNDPDAWKG